MAVILNLSKAKELIDYKYILNIYNQEEIFQEALGYFPKTGEMYFSPFRKDTKPGCRFEWKGDWLLFIDNIGEFYNCFQFQQKFRNLNFQDVVSYLFRKRPVTLKVQYEKETTYRNFKSLIRITKKEWQEDNYFTKNFNIDINFLNSEPIFNILNYWCNSKKDNSLARNRFGNIKPGIAYYFEETQHLKLYFPESQTTKWHSNCVQEDIFNWHNIDKFNGDTLIITKSGKDALLIWYHLQIPVIAVQSEGISLPDKVIKFLESYKQIVIIFDNDEAGLIAAEKTSNFILKTFDNKNVIKFFLPQETKDAADYYLKHSNIDCLKQFKEN